eukprot:TRINITY_DN1266_c0_g6_i1.p1 TRINITY_DN1266_c0_g6~~TRINITY_DN1266_c0_g6_i1.p1  ORF type:complete len:573 (+),score=110.44 TRINITY_DN1266_c0_g6_i1:63-1781(+)
MLYFLTLLPLISAAGTSASGGGFLQHNPDAHFHIGDLEFQQAIESVMGCGSMSKEGREKRFLDEVERALSPMWRVAPKNSQERVEWRMVRYLAHRYFMQSSSLLIRGLEPIRSVNDTHSGVGDILTKRVPSLVDVVEGRLSSNGFSFEETVTLIATLKQVIFDSESSLLEYVYKQHHTQTAESITHEELSNMLETYLVNWMVNDEAAAKVLLRTPLLLEEHIGQWPAIKEFASGLIRNMEFARTRTPRIGQGMNTMMQRYSFDDAHEVVASITRTFAFFWETECKSIKSTLVGMDRSSIGRVPLSDFYAAKAAGEWRFAESESYLRELGALDETPGRPKQVIIANYLQGANNCIVTNSHYFVCCVNECESILSEIEDAVGSPVAVPDDILRTLANMTDFDEEPLKLADALKDQLRRIAETHGGKVPLHGRLFAQWLHFVLPRECPFPHKVGTQSVQAPMEFGKDYLVSDDVVQAHAGGARSSAGGEEAASSLAAELDEAQWMSHWNEEEELKVDYSIHLRAPWERRHFGSLASLAVLALILMGAGAIASHGKDKLANGNSVFFDSSSKAHFV